MKVLLYTEGLSAISKSGLGKSIRHQMKALDSTKITYTTNTKDEYDIIHVNFYGPKSYFIARKARKMGKKVIYHAHSTEEDFKNSFKFSNFFAPLFKRWIIKCYKLGDQIITPTEYSKRILEGYKLNRPIKVISNGIETSFFEKDTKAGQEFRKKYGYKKTDKVIVGIGLYIKRKGILDFVELAKRLPKYKFIWFGYSPLWASPKEIKEAIKTDLPNLHFAGYVDSSEIKSALSGANLYLFPTYEETEGMPLIEALTSKIPTLIRDIPVFEEYEDKKVVYKAKDIDDFEKKIKLIMTRKLPRLTDKGYRAAKKKDLKNVGKELAKTYTEVLGTQKITKPKKTKEKKEIVVNEKKPFNRLWYLIPVLVLIAGITLILTTREKPLEEFRKTFNFFDTEIDVRIYTRTESKAKKAFDEIYTIYSEYDQLVNRESGELYYIRTNTSSDSVLTIDHRLYEMLEFGIEWYEISNGLFNINMGNVTDVWNSHRSKNTIPTRSELQNAGSISITDIELLGNNQIRNTRPNIDLTLLVRSFATNTVGEHLTDMGITAFLINAGGTVVLGDHFETNGLYIISIASPFKDEEIISLGTLFATNHSISSSGMYQNYFEYNNHAYGHIINPKTLFPSEYMISVTVIAADSPTAAAMSATLFSMPRAEGIELVESIDGIEALWSFIDSEGKHIKRFSTNWNDRHR